MYKDKEDTYKSPLESFQGCDRRWHWDLERVASSDWHSASWLTTSELAKALEIAESANTLGIDYEYKVLLKTLRDYETDGDTECRIVFWFDN